MKSEYAKAILSECALPAALEMGERWISGLPSNPVLVDRHSRRPVATLAVRAADGRPLSLPELGWIDRSEVAGTG